MDVDMNVDRVLVDEAGVWGCCWWRGQDVGQVIGDSQAVRPGGPRWRSMCRPCACAKKASRGGHRERW